ncbi:MAG: inverse autotransporter beta domain-containing protein [Betaproteobacteria bacterium]|nr:inverse autotransporter beta domain-containing protein [Betaproteobacteria bacterium]
MAGIGYWRGIGLCGLAALSFGALANEQTQAQPSGDLGPKWGPHIDFEAKLGSKRNLGEADLLLPIAQDARTLVFSSLRGRFDDNSSLEGNFGLGVRRMLESGWNLGAYGYFDRRRSDTGNFFNQGTLGVEALGRDWDFRANGYLPIGTRVRDLGETSSAALSGAAVQVTSTTREERALKGFDAEMGWRAPLFDSEAARQLRLYLGGYRFNDDVIKVVGPRVRAELAMEELPWFGKGTKLFLGAEAQDDSARGSQTFLSVRLRIPLGKESSAPSTLNAQERRMTAPVMRDVDIVTQSRVSSTLTEAATQTAGGQTITVLNSATTTGAALPGAVTGLANGSTILLSGTFNTTASVDLTGNKSLIAGNVTVLTPSGRTAVLSSPATISNSNNALNFIIAAPGNNTISGLTISGTRAGGSGYGIHINDTAGNVSILNNTITMTQTGNNAILGIAAAQQNQNLTISGNTVTVVGKAGQTATGLGLLGTTGPASATVSGNTLNVSGGGNNYAVWVDNQTTINAGSTGNVLVSGTCNGGPTASGSVGFTNGTTCP